MTNTRYKAALIALIVSGLAGCGQVDQDNNSVEKKSEQQAAPKKATSSHIKPGENQGW